MAQLHTLCFSSSPTITTTIPHTCSILPSSSSPSFLSYHRPTTTAHLSLRTSTLRPHPITSCTSSSSSSVLTVAEETVENSTTRLLAQNVPWSCTPDDIRTLFQQYGTVLDVELSMHNKTRNRGLAFVEMGSAEEAAQALAKLESFDYEGRTLRLSYAKPKKQKVSRPVQDKPPVIYNLFVANLSFDARAKDLRELFKSGGFDLASAEVMFQGKPRRSSGYGFVSFKTKREADVALTTFEGKELMGRPITVARSNRFVKLETELKPEEPAELTGDEQEMSTSSEEPAGGDNE